MIVTKDDKTLGTFFGYACCYCELDLIFFFFVEHSFVHILPNFFFAHLSFPEKLKSYQSCISCPNILPMYTPRFLIMWTFLLTCYPILLLCSIVVISLYLSDPVFTQLKYL